MRKLLEDKNIYRIIMPIFIIIYYFPTLFSKIYISSDEFSSIAVPAILSGHNWRSVLSLHSYHGVGYTIFLTPVFWKITDGITAHIVIVVASLLLKIILGELLFSLFSHFKVEIKISFLGAIAYVCGIFGCDEYGLSVLSELPFAVLIAVIIFCLERYRITKKQWLCVCAVFAIAYTYTIHSRCLILFIALGLTGLIYVIREKAFGKKVVFAAGIFLLSFAVCYILLKAIQYHIYDAFPTQELTNDPGMVLHSSSYQLVKLLKIQNLFDILKISICMSTAQCMISLGVGAVALVICVYVVIFDFLKKGKTDTLIVYLSYLAIFCIFGMNFAMGIQSVGRIKDGNYAWLTYIRYAAPFWLIPYIVFVYFFNKMISRLLKCFLMVGVLAMDMYINVYLAPILNNGFGLKYSVLNRIFYDDSLGTDLYFKFFCKCALIFCMIITICWNSKKYKGYGMMILTICMLVTNYQYQNYYLEKQDSEYDTIDKSASLIEDITNQFENIEIYGDSEAILYISKLQYMCFDKMIQIYQNEPVEMGGNDIFFSNNGGCEIAGAKIIEIDTAEYVYVVSDDLYKYISNRYK